MRSFAALVASTVLSSSTIAGFPIGDSFQQPDGRVAAPAPSSAIRACSVLPKEEVRTILGVDPKTFNLVPLQEDSLPGGGSACEYMGAGIQIDPFPVARLAEMHKTSGQTWTPIAGLGESAYYNDRTKQSPYAELYAASRNHVVTVQMSVDRPDTAESVRPKAVALAKALLAKLP